MAKEKKYFHLVKTHTGFIPASDDDYESCKNIGIGEVLQAKSIAFRKYELLQKYHVFISTLWEYLNEDEQAHFKSKECLRETLQVSAGHCYVIWSFKLNQFVEISKSVSYDSIDEPIMREVYKNVVDIAFKLILNKRVTEEDYNKYFNNF